MKLPLGTDVNAHKKKMPLDNYLFFIFLCLFFLLSISSIIGNILTSFPAIANVKWACGIVLCGIGLVLIKRQKWIEGYKTLVFSLILGFVIFPSWFVGGGDNTFTLMYLLVLAVEALMMFQTRWLRILFVLLCAWTGIAFIVIDSFFAHLVHPTQGQNVFLDSVLQIVMIFALTGTSVAIYANSYRNQNRMLETIAYVDILSGLYNRRKIIEVLEHSTAANETPFTHVMMLDIDNFKSINDTNGHAVGDAIIVNLAERLRSALGDFGFAGRYGGDEFLVLLRCDAAELAAFVQRLLQSAPADGHHYALSGGVAPIDTGKSIDALISGADKLLYTAKEHGRNRIYFWDTREICGTSTALPVNAPVAQGD